MIHQYTRTGSCAVDCMLLNTRVVHGRVLQVFVVNALPPIWNECSVLVRGGGGGGRTPARLNITSSAPPMPIITSLNFIHNFCLWHVSLNI